MREILVQELAKVRNLRVFMLNRDKHGRAHSLTAYIILEINNLHGIRVLVSPGLGSTLSTCVWFPVIVFVIWYSV